MPYVLKHEGDTLDPRSARWSRTRCAIFGWPGSIYLPTRKPDTAKSRSGWRSWPPSFRENVLDAGARLHAQRHQ